MFTFNFNEVIDRTHSDSEKWHKYANQDVIPLWVADVDFKSPPAVIEALQTRVAQGVFGYGYTPPELIEVIVERMHKLYDWKIQPDWLVFLPGLVCGLNLSVRAFTKEGDQVITPNPVYGPFQRAVRQQQRQLVKAPQILQDTRWVIDLQACEPAVEASASMMILCNPHNPGGTVYTREELTTQLAFAQQHNLVICSDEIHCDLILDKKARHIPIASLSPDAEQRTITLMAPSKTFNIAGLGASFAIIPNAQLRKAFCQERLGFVPSVDILAYVAATAAYRDGQAWLEAQLDYLRGNYQLVLEKVNQMKSLQLQPFAATYLAWIDASALPVANPQAFFEQAGVGLSAGSEFGDRQFLRLNFGCSRRLLETALERMQKAIEQL